MKVSTIRQSSGSVGLDSPSTDDEDSAPATAPHLQHHFPPQLNYRVPISQASNASSLSISHQGASEQSVGTAAAVKTVLTDSKGLKRIAVSEDVLDVILNRTPLVKVKEIMATAASHFEMEAFCRDYLEKAKCASKLLQEAVDENNPLLCECELLLSIASTSTSSSSTDISKRSFMAMSSSPLTSTPSSSSSIEQEVTRTDFFSNVEPDMKSPKTSHTNS